jgi:HPt (histidine-containing phosphotransfer) domain-containing protein
VNPSSDPPSAPRDDASLRSHDCVDRILQDLAGDAELLEQMVDAYLSELAETIPAITGADRSGDSQGLAAWTHRLRGSFAVLHADRGRELALAIETQLATGQSPGPGAVRDLLEEARQLGRDLLAWRDGRGSDGHAL